jgi:hypothetical protein
MTARFGVRPADNLTLDGWVAYNLSIRTAESSGRGLTRGFRPRRMHIPVVRTCTDRDIACDWNT